MGKIVAAMNITIDGFCDHTAGLPDEALHRHYEELLKHSDAILYGRITYNLMEYWRTFIEHPSGKRSMDDFAKAIDKIPKIVFSHTLKHLEWHSAKLSHQPIEAIVPALRQQAGGDILIGSRSLIVQLTNLELIDEYQLCIYPVATGKGLPLFEHIKDRTIFKFLKTKTFESGAVIHYYQPT